MDKQCDTCKYFLIEKYSIVKGICMFPVIVDKSFIDPNYKNYYDVCKEWGERINILDYKNIIDNFFKLIENNKKYQKIHKNMYEPTYS